MGLELRWYADGHKSLLDVAYAARPTRCGTALSEDKTRSHHTCDPDGE